LSNPRRSIFLRDGCITVGIAPDCGGALSRFDVRTGDSLTAVLRPAVEQDPAIRCALGASCFPLVPYGGRLREGRFEFERRRYEFPLNALPERHSSHGDGWCRPWSLTHLDRRNAVMNLEADESAPFQYECAQSISIDLNRVSVKLRARNTSARRIPMGFGLHPYFANRSCAVVKADVPTRWQWDAEMMPVREEANPDAAGFLRGQRVRELPATAEYAGWGGAAAIDWPALQLRVSLETTPALRHVVMWMPPGKDFFCFEPVSHATDALNGGPDRNLSDGFVVMEPNATAEQRFDFVVARCEPPAA